MIKYATVKPGTQVKYIINGDVGKGVRESDDPQLVFVLYEGDNAAKATYKRDLRKLCGCKRWMPLTNWQCAKCDREMFD